MGWTTLTKRAIGYLVTKANDIDLWIDDIHYLKGQDGNVEMESGIISDTDVTDPLGSSSKRWSQIHGRSLYANRFRVTPEIREIRITWEDPTNASVQASKVATGAASGGAGGTGQVQIQLDRAQVQTIRWDNQTEQNSAYDTSFAVSRQPYLRLEF